MFFEFNTLQGSLKDRETVSLQRGPHGLGFSFNTYQNERGIYVNTIMPGGPAASTGKLKEGDRILMVSLPHCCVCVLLS